MTQEKYALLSVYNKSGIEELAKALVDLGYHIISSGGTAKVLTENNIPVIPIQEITKNPESFDGRMKTISFQIESGILYDRKNAKHRAEAEALDIKPIDIVVCNLYPFEKTPSIETIDVGGPTMVRAAAKNHESVLVVIDPNDYHMVIKLLHSRKVTDVFRRWLAGKAFHHLSFYDAQVAGYLSHELFPQEHTLAGRKFMDLRYGENPHQKAAVYLHPQSNSPFQNLKKLWGRALSLTNVTDINAGLELARLFKEPAAVVIKHNNPCGIALGETITEALERAIEADPESAFGGVIILNKPLDKKTAEIVGNFKDERKSNIDIIAAPRAEKQAVEFLSKVRKTMGIYTFGALKKSRSKRFDIKWIDGGYVVQTHDDDLAKGFKEWKVVTKKNPTEKQLEQMKLAWLYITRIRSNAIIVVDKNLPMTRGIGTGQTSRVRSVKIALDQAKAHIDGAILASDSFFPFDDSVILATKAGIGAIVQQGGSMNDQASIDAADKAGIPMVFTTRRAFWH